MIRKSNPSDLDSIMAIIKDTIKEMHSYNNFQWDENYPLAKDFIPGIENGELYIHDTNGEVSGFICIDYTQPNEYKDINWSSSQDCMVIHRMAINPAFRNKGIATQLMQFAEELAISNNIKYLKTDTYSLNIKMHSLFIKLNYKQVGEMNFLGKKEVFYCYDKQL